MKNLLKNSLKTKYQILFNKLYSWEDIAKNVLIMLVLILVLDYFNILTKATENKEFIPIYLVVIAFLFITFLEFKPWNLYKLLTVNYVDSFLITTIVALAIYSFLTIQQISWKTILGVVIMIVFFVLELIRIKRINKENTTIIKSNVYDLKDLYDGKITNVTKLALIREKEVDYDLLERGYIINNLKQLITNCYTDEKFVISLEGSWGSGKTTIINNLKKSIKENNNIIVIDDFDPWSYEDEQSLFRGMFDSFMSEIGINFSIRDINNFLKLYMETIFSNSKFEKTYTLIKRYYSRTNKPNKMKTIINDYLTSNNKKILFIIDNIERAEKENIIFLFKLINNILNFNNTIYLLSFDNEKMKQIFENSLNIDYDYLKKIIQLEVKVPKVQDSVMHNVVERCIKNLLKIYGISDDVTEYTNAIKLISDKINDLRDLKRYLNSVISFGFNTKNYLNSQDTFLLELIKNNNIALYKAIWDNKQFFISEDTDLLKTSYLFDTKGLNVDGKTFFDNLFSDKENKEYIDILSLMFPYVKRYKEKRDLKDEYHGYIIPGDNTAYAEKVKESRISNARYFDLYFTQCENEFTEIIKGITKFIKVINDNNDMIIVDDEFIILMNLYNNWLQKYTFEVLQFSLPEINNKLLLLKILYKHLGEYNDDMLFLGINALFRIHVIIAEILLILPVTEFDEFMSIIENDYSNTYTIHQLIYWMENTKKQKDEYWEIKLNKLKDVAKSTVTNIIEKRIDIFTDEIYREKNVYGIYHGTKEDEVKRKEYIEAILNPNNIFKFLNDIIGRSLGTSYGYSITEDNLNSFTSKEYVKDIIDKVNRELTEDEKMILEIFQKSGKSNFTGVEENGEGLFLKEDKKFVV